MKPPRRIELAPTQETDRRRREVQFLLNVAEPDPEYQPLFLSDEASLVSALAPDEATIRARLSVVFGEPFDLDLGKPVCQLVELIRGRFPGWPDDWPREPN